MTKRIKLQEGDAFLMYTTCSRRQEISVQKTSRCFLEFRNYVVKGSVRMPPGRNVLQPFVIPQSAVFDIFSWTSSPWLAKRENIFEEPTFLTATNFRAWHSWEKVKESFCRKLFSSFPASKQITEADSLKRVTENIFAARTNPLKKRRNNALPTWSL